MTLPEMKVFVKLFLFSVVSIFFVSCSKDMGNRVPVNFPPQPLSFHISTSKLVLLQGNESNTAVTLNWEGGKNAGDENIKYTVEAAIRGTSFEDAVAIGSSNSTAIAFTVKEFNSQMRKLINAGADAMVDLRVKQEAPHVSQAVYSDAMALQVTTYHDHKEYDNAHIIRIPGNYQEWKLPTAPKVVATSQSGEYEGYINFTNPYTQFLMVKGTTEWDPKVTYNYIGSDKIGFGGSVFSIFGGAGAYRLKVNMNNNTWVYTKIACWGLNGSAVSNDANADLCMKPDASGLSWSITANLAKGSFRLRANNSNNLVFGHNTSGEIGVPDYNGENIRVNNAGNYTITLSLTEAGNYAYGIQRNS